MYCCTQRKFLPGTIRGLFLKLITAFLYALCIHSFEMQKKKYIFSVEGKIETNGVKVQVERIDS